MCAAPRHHLYLVPPLDDAPIVPAATRLPETIAYFMAQQPEGLVTWLMNSDETIPAQLRRIGGDLYLMDLRHAEREAVAERFMLCVELVRQFSIYRGGAFDDEARLTFALLSTTVAERAWLESSNTPQADALRAMQQRIANAKKVDETLLQNYADAMRQARSAHLMDLDQTFRHAIDRLSRR